MFIPHNRTVRSPLPLVRMRPSGLNATAKTMSVWPVIPEVMLGPVCVVPLGGRLLDCPGSAQSGDDVGGGSIQQPPPCGRPSGQKLVCHPPQSIGACFESAANMAG
ncbi:MAG TPA: hypothetical protein VK784_17185 [Pseudonocardiaceae bacterium]|nr:hypothetical protein [Pseudonocardiaceae bacterium]